MRHILWIGHAEFVARLKRELNWEGFTPIHHTLSPEPWMLEDPGRQGVQGIFQKILTTLMDIAHQDPIGLRALRETTVIVLLPSWAPASWGDSERPIVPAYEATRGHYFAPSQAMDLLLLAFPEVRWVFLSQTKPPTFLSQLHAFEPQDIVSKNWIKTLYPFVSPLFDGSGLRSFLRRELYARENFGVDWSRLHRFALAVDEEPSYAFFESYTAFRMGYRSIPITTERAMSLFLGTNGLPLRADLVFEDLFINFPDRTIEDHLSNLKKRDDLFPRLRDPRCVRRRVLVTVGHHRLPSPDILQNNRDYMEQLRSWGVEVIPVLKPLSGIYALVRDARLQSPSPTLLEIARWNERFHGDQKDQHHGHSAPGALSLVARILLQRARAFLDIQEDLTVEDAVHGAVLALEAKELLAGRTPTLTLQALALQHELEVIAESRFYGVETHIDVDQRAEELDREIRSVVRWFHPSRQEATHRNVMVRILTRIMRRLEEVNLVEEAERTLHHIREQERRIWSVYRRSRSGRRMGFFGYPIVNGIWWYINQLMASPAQFLGFSLLWILIFGAIYGLYPGKRAEPWEGFTRGMLESMLTFLSFSPMRSIWNDGSLRILLLSGIESALGFLHFGVLVSYLYRLVARR